MGRERRKGRELSKNAKTAKCHEGELDFGPPHRGNSHTSALSQSEGKVAGVYILPNHQRLRTALCRVESEGNSQLLLVSWAGKLQAEAKVLAGARKHTGS